jgi:hypothetical protein
VKPRQVTAEKSGHASGRPVGRIWFPREIGGQVAELEVIEHDTGIRTGYVEAGGVFVAGDQVHRADVVDIRQQLASGVRVIDLRADVEPHSPDGQHGRHASKSASASVDRKVGQHAASISARFAARSVHLILDLQSGRSWRMKGQSLVGVAPCVVKDGGKKTHRSRGLVALQ